jgi:hypothetical protein
LIAAVLLRLNKLKSLDFIKPVVKVYIHTMYFVAILQQQALPCGAARFCAGSAFVITLGHIQITPCYRG